MIHESAQMFVVISVKLVWFYWYLSGNIYFVGSQKTEARSSPENFIYKKRQSFYAQLPLSRYFPLIAINLKLVISSDFRLRSSGLFKTISIQFVVVSLVSFLDIKICS